MSALRALEARKLIAPIKFVNIDEAREIYPQQTNPVWIGIDEAGGIDETVYMEFRVQDMRWGKMKQTQGEFNEEWRRAFDKALTSVAAGYNDKKRANKTQPKPDKRPYYRKFEKRGRSR